MEGIRTTVRIRLHGKVIANELWCLPRRFRFLLQIRVTSDQPRQLWPYWCLVIFVKFFSRGISPVPPKLQVNSSGLLRDLSRGRDFETAVRNTLTSIQEFVKILSEICLTAEQYISVLLIIDWSSSPNQTCWVLHLLLPSLGASGEPI